MIFHAYVENHPRSWNEVDGDVGWSGAEFLAERFGLRVEPGARRDAATEQPDDHEVEREQVGEPVSLDPAPGNRRHEDGQSLGGQVTIQPGELGIRADPDADVGVAALVARPGARDQPDRNAPGRAGRVWLAGRGGSRRGGGRGWRGLSGRGGRGGSRRGGGWGWRELAGHGRRGLGSGRAGPD